MSEAEHPEELPPVPSEEEIAAELAQVEATGAADGAAGVAGTAGAAGAEGVDGVDGGEQPRRYPSTIGGAFYIGILVATAVGIGIVWGGNWRLGMHWVGGALIAGACLRLVLRTRDAGMLAARHRVVDCTLLGGVGGLVIFLAQTIPDQPGF